MRLYETKFSLATAQKDRLMGPEGERKIFWLSGARYITQKISVGISDIFLCHMLSSFPLALIQQISFSQARAHFPLSRQSGLTIFEFFEVDFSVVS